MIDTTARKRRKSSGPRLRKVPAPVEQRSFEESYAVGVTKALANTLKITCPKQRRAVYCFLRVLQTASKDITQAAKCMADFADAYKDAGLCRE